MKEYQGQLIGNNSSFGIVVSRFNELITKNLLAGAIDGLRRHGVSQDSISVFWVPGAFEIPLIAKQIAMTNQFHAIICLGAVIKGATPHFDYVAGQVASGITKISQDHDLPVIFGVLTTNTIEEALERAGTKMGNKGFECASAAIEMVNLLGQIKKDYLFQDHSLDTYCLKSAERLMD